MPGTGKRPVEPTVQEQLEAAVEASGIVARKAAREAVTTAIAPLSEQMDQILAALSGKAAAPAAPPKPLEKIEVGAEETAEERKKRLVRHFAGEEEEQPAPAGALKPPGGKALVAEPTGKATKAAAAAGPAEQAGAGELEGQVETVVLADLSAAGSETDEQQANWDQQKQAAAQAIMDVLAPKKLDIDPYAFSGGKMTVKGSLIVGVAEGRMSAEEAVEYAKQQGWLIEVDYRVDIISTLTQMLEERGEFGYRLRDTVQGKGRQIGVAESLSAAIESGEYTYDDALRFAIDKRWAVPIRYGTGHKKAGEKAADAAEAESNMGRNGKPPALGGPKPPRRGKNRSRGAP